MAPSPNSPDDTRYETYSYYYYKFARMCHKAVNLYHSKISHPRFLRVKVKWTPVTALAAAQQVVGPTFCTAEGKADTEEAMFSACCLFECEAEGLSHMPSQPRTPLAPE